MRYIFLILITITATLFTACSSKEVFKPKQDVNNWEHVGSSEVEIKNVSQDAALIQDRKVLAEDKIFDVSITQDEKLLGYADGWIITTSINGNLTLIYAEDSTMVEKFNLKKTIAAVNVKDDTLAVLFANNDIALYSIANKKLLLKEQGNPPLAVNAKIIKPYFKDDIVIFPTLNGKIILVNLRLKKKLRTVTVSSEKYFDNIIYLDLIDNKIIAATGHKILSLSKKEIRANFDIRSIISDKETIFVATKQGEILSLTPDLNQNAKVKFPFAHFLGMIISNDKLYVLEKEGYIIEISKDLLDYTVYEVDLNAQNIFISDKVFYIDDEYISVK
jgi:outer membrane protein assembly factor BamB